MIEHSFTDRQFTFIVRSVVPIEDAPLTVEQLTLEDVVLAYLSRSGEAHRP
ncbi:hypothetical protein [Micromonospora rubida]